MGEGLQAMPAAIEQCGRVAESRSAIVSQLAR